MREMISNLEEYIATPRTAKHRIFTTYQVDVIPESEIVVFASSDKFILGVLSSHIHVLWTLAQGGTLEDRPRYNNSRCFETFPFPTPTEPQKQKIRALAERLDAHRKRQQAQHPKLTMTGMYNVLEKERAGEALTDKERKIHEQGLVSILGQLHDELDAAVAAAYGWEDLLEGLTARPTSEAAQRSADELLQRLVNLNAERAAEEARGLVRWLRPDYQAPDEAAGGTQSALELEAAADVPVAVVAEKRKWPKTKPEQVRVLRELLAGTGGAVSGAALAGAFKPKLTKKRLAEAEGLVETLRELGLVG